MRWVALLVCGTGCFAPAPPEGAPCGDGLRPCPAGQQCNPADDRCYADPPAGNPDAASDAPLDAPTSGACIPRRLLTGGMPVEQQGWTIERVGAGTVTYSPGTTTLATTNNARQLIVLRDAFPSNKWSIRITAEVTSTGGCTPNNAAVAFMASFHAPAGDDADRARMLCIGPDKAVWGDGVGSIGVSLVAIGVITLERTSPAGIRATVQSGAGMASMTAGGFTSNGTLAIGDQSTDPGLDSSLEIISIDLMCP